MADRRLQYERPGCGWNVLLRNAVAAEHQSVVLVHDRHRHTQFRVEAHLVASFDPLPLRMNRLCVYDFTAKQVLQHA